MEEIKGKELKKKWIRFEYENVVFEGELEYREGDLISLLGQKIYEIKITKPLPYSISFTPRKEAHPIRRLFYGMGKVELDVILNMVETYQKYCVCDIITHIFHSSTPNSNLETNI